MYRRSTRTTDQSAHARISKHAKRLLQGAGVVREDSDDELGHVDHPWEWIPRKHVESHVNVGEKRTRKESERRTESGFHSSHIIGAQMGAFQIMLGDCVLLKAENSKEAWVGLICSFEEIEGEGAEKEKAANFMWFSSEKEVRNVERRRTDALPSELYITPSWDVNPLTSINGRASIVSPGVFNSKHPTGKVSRSSKDYGKIFICRRGCDTRTAAYTEEFIWEDIYKGTEEHVFALIQTIQQQTKNARKRNKRSVSETYVLDAQAETVVSPSTPKKKIKLKAPTSTSNIRCNTPMNRKMPTRKPLEFTPLGTRLLSPSNLVSSPFQVARTRLHVSAVPGSLPCREAEFEAAYSHLEAAISDGSGSCIYISGTPGTGKTATVRAVVAQLSALVSADELDDFIFVEINGMKVVDPHQSYSLLWEALHGDRVSPSNALNLLDQEFNNPSPRRVPCVVLMDELDQLVTKNQSVMYNFFNWPGLRHSKLIVLAIANTMDLPERTLSNKISSRLGLTRLTFPGYSHNQLIRIIESRLSGVEGDLLDPDAIQFASRKVAAVSGDARRALDICRRAVEIAEAEVSTSESLPPTPSKHNNIIQTRGAREERRMLSGRVTISTIKQAISEATSTPLQQCLKGLPLASKVFLAAFLTRIRQIGICDALLGDVLNEAERFVALADKAYLKGCLLLLDDLVDMNGLAANNLTSKAPRALAMGNAAMELMDAGIVGLEARKGERAAKIRLIVGEEEVQLALKDDADLQGLGFSAIS